MYVRNVVLINESSQFRPYWYGMYRFMLLHFHETANKKNS